MRAHRVLSPTCLLVLGTVLLPVLLKRLFIRDPMTQGVDPPPSHKKEKSLESLGKRSDKTRHKAAAGGLIVGENYKGGKLQSKGPPLSISVSGSLPSMGFCRCFTTTLWVTRQNDMVSMGNVPFALAPISRSKSCPARFNLAKISVTVKREK